MKLSRLTRLKHIETQRSIPQYFDPIPLLRVTILDRADAVGYGEQQIIMKLDPEAFGDEYSQNEVRHAQAIIRRDWDNAKQR
jgi:hypothetical protein